VAIANILRRIAEEEALVFSDIKSCLEEFPPSGYPSVALSSLALLLATEDSPLKRDQIYQQTRVSADLVDRTRSSGDIGAALTMQEIRLIGLVQSPHWLVEMQKYCHIHGESIQCLKTIHGREVLPMPPLHNLLLLTEDGAFLPLVASQQHLIEEQDMLGRSLLHLTLDLGIGENMHASHLVGKSTTTIIDAFGRSPLHIACSEALYDIIKLLLNNDADVDLKDNWGQTPLSWAAVGGHKAVVRLLLDRSADVESKDIYGRTPLSWATKRGHEAVVKLLLDKGADINLKGEDGWTPLLRAAGRGHEAVVRLLLEKGAAIESNDNSGWTPLSWAAGRGHEAVVRLLLEKGAAIELKDELGCTPLSWAAEEGHEAVVQLLLEKGAAIEPNDNRGRTPLLRAVERGHEAVVRLLLEKGAAIELKDELSCTPLS
jgi:ankyrin repeat protein